MKMMKWGLGGLGLVIAGGVTLSALGLGGLVSAQEPPPADEQLKIERPAREKMRHALMERRPGVVRAVKNAFRAAAEVIGIEPRALRDELKAGKSLTQIASENDVSRDTLKNELLDRLSAQITQAAAEGKITEEQKTTLLNGLNTRIDQLLDATRDGRGKGPLGGSGLPRGGGQTP